MEEEPPSVAVEEEPTEEALEDAAVVDPGAPPGDNAYGRNHPYLLEGLAAPDPRYRRGMHSKRAIVDMRRGNDYMRAAQGGLYAISADAVDAPGRPGEIPRRVKIGMANHYDTRLGPYETSLPDGFQVHYLMTMPTGQRGSVDQLSRSRMQKLGQENLLKRWMTGQACGPDDDPNSPACRVAQDVKPLNRGNEWFEATNPDADPDTVIEYAKAGMQEIFENSTFPSTLLEMQRDGMNVLDRRETGSTAPRVSGGATTRFQEAEAAAGRDPRASRVLNPETGEYEYPAT